MLQLLSTRASTSPPVEIPVYVRSCKLTLTIFSVAAGVLFFFLGHGLTRNHRASLTFWAVSFLLFFVGIQHLRLLYIHYTIYTPPEN